MPYHNSLRASLNSYTRDVGLLHWCASQLVYKLWQERIPVLAEQKDFCRNFFEILQNLCNCKVWLSPTFTRSYRAESISFRNPDAASKYSLWFKDHLFFLAFKFRSKSSEDKFRRWQQEKISVLFIYGSNLPWPWMKSMPAALQIIDETQVFRYPSDTFRINA